MRVDSSEPTRVLDLVTTDLISISPADLVGQARDLMAEGAVHALPVIDADGVVGIVTTADLADGPADEDLITTVMTPAPEMIAIEASVAEAAERMIEYRIHHLLVTNGEEVIGILSSLDLLHALLPLPGS